MFEWAGGISGLRDRQEQEPRGRNERDQTWLSPAGPPRVVPGPLLLCSGQLHLPPCCCSEVPSSPGPWGSASALPSARLPSPGFFLSSGEPFPVSYLKHLPLLVLSTT